MDSWDKLNDAMQDCIKAIQDCQEAIRDCHKALRRLAFIIITTQLITYLLIVLKWLEKK